MSRRKIGDFAIGAIFSPLEDLTVSQGHFSNHYGWLNAAEHVIKKNQRLVLISKILTNDGSLFNFLSLTEFSLLCDHFYRDAVFSNYYVACK